MPQINNAPQEANFTSDEAIQEGDFSESLSELSKEIRAQFPTPLSIVDAYRFGTIDFGVLSAAFSEEEIEEILAEAEKRKQK